MFDNLKNADLIEIALESFDADPSGIEAFVERIAKLPQSELASEADLENLERVLDKAEGIVTTSEDGVVTVASSNLFNFTF